ncbi:MAG: UDP-N-acetylmuramoyl-L-alanine--D-glutamate ligase [Pseudobdellovibrio sp.]
MTNTKLDLTSLSNFKKPFVIIGAGKSGLAAGELLKKAGTPKQEIYFFDEKKQTDLKSWLDFSSLPIGTLVVSPGVPLKNPEITKLVNQGWIVTSEISLSCLFLKNEKIIGVTGSVAKSTVTTLIGLAAKQSDTNTFIGGNIGIPFAEYVISVLDGKPRAKWIILELSSYQLENCFGLKLEHSVITFLTSNHLERYESVQSYYLTKCAIGNMTKGYCVINKSSKDLISYQNSIACKVLSINAETFQNPELLQSINLLGEHNRDNFSLAFSICQLCGFDSNAIQKMSQYTGLNHRIEIVALHNSILFINDSKATAMDSVLVAVKAALEKLKYNAKLHLLLGGKDKNLPWQDLQSLNAHPQIKIYFFGECGELAKTKMNNLTGLYKKTLNDCINLVFDSVLPNDIVLLSPGGTSLDEFKNFEERGDYFKNKVFNFIQKNG